MGKKKSDESLKDKIEKMQSDFGKKAIRMEQAKNDYLRSEKAKEERIKLGISDSEAESLSDTELEAASTLTKAIMIIRDYDAIQRYGKGARPLSDEQHMKLVNFFSKDSEAKEVLFQAFDIYEGSVEYGKYIVGIRNLWQRVLGEMTSLLVRWTAADEIAKGMTTALQNVHKVSQDFVNSENKWVSPDGSQFPKEVWLSSFIKILINNFEKAVEDSPYKIYFNYNSEEEKFEADIDKGGLYQEILKKAKMAEFQIQALKSTIEPFAKFLYTEITFANGESTLPLWFIPKIVRGLVKYPEFSEFQADPNNRKYFKYYLLQNKDAGDTITPEEEKRAVIPAYNEATEIDHYIDTANSKLLKFFSNFITDDEREARK